MINFNLIRPADQAAALAASAHGTYIAGGTDLMQLMKDRIEAPSTSSTSTASFRKPSLRPATACGSRRTRG